MVNIFIYLYLNINLLYLYRMDIITGEKLQEICNIYIGHEEDFRYNPRIFKQKEKHMLFQNIPYEYDNPKIIFTYTHRLDELYYYIDSFKNEFILITHNSDENITEKYLKIAEHEKIIHWFSQNVMIDHSKLSIIPIGIANSMWDHGNLDCITPFLFNKNKTQLLYFNFNVNTNVEKRQECKEILEQNGYIFTESKLYSDYLKELSESKFCICPEGNGIDSHRIWESLYCGTIPIMLRNIFTEKVEKNYPCILLNSWEELNDNIFNNYKDYLFSKNIKNELDLLYYKSLMFRLINV